MAEVVTSARITAALRYLYPAPVALSTRRAGAGDWAVTLPATSAAELRIGVDHRVANEYLTGRLGQVVHVAETHQLRAHPLRADRRVEFTVRLGACQGVRCRAPHDPVGGRRPVEVRPGRRRPAHLRDGAS